MNKVTGADVDALAAEYAAEYVMSTEGPDYTPTQWERELILDALYGFVSDHRLAAQAEPREWRVPAGWKLVPVEPTEAMCEAGDLAAFRKRNDMACMSPTEEPESGGGPYGYAWRAMLAAAPEPPAKEAEGGA